MSHTIFVRFPFRHPCKCFFSQSISGMNYTDLRFMISSVLGNTDFLLYYNGKELTEGQNVLPDSTVFVSFSLPGGKGGFGSMLRAIGAQIEKTTNREACRDLSGRRLRDINEEQRLKKWIAKKAEREAEKARRRRERIERLKSRPKHNFVDFEYEKEISQLPERVDEALSAGLEKAKRPLDAIEPSTSSKRKRLWLDEEMSDSSDSDLEKNLINVEQNESSKDENEACCSTSLDPTGKSENLETSSSNDSSVDTAPVYEDRSDSIPSTLSSSDDQANPAQADAHKEATSPPENSEETALCSEVKKENESLQEIAPKNIDCTPNQSQVVAEGEPKDESMPVDLSDYNSAAELEALGLQRLKLALMERGLKCGGNIVDRAQRLWAVRGLAPEQYPKNLLAKSKK